MKINDIILKEFARSILFEKELNEMFQPDDDMHAGKNMRYSMYDRPGPDLDVSSVLDIEDMPISPDNISANQLHGQRKEIEKLLDVNYFPKNKVELGKSLKDAIEQIDMSNNDIEKFWVQVKTYLNNKK